MLEEGFFCPFCGTSNLKSNNFCSKCGANLQNGISSQTQSSIVAASSGTPSHAFQGYYQPNRIVTAPIPSNKVTAIVIIGLIINITTFLILSWVSWIVPIYLNFAFFPISLVGVILGGLSIKDNQTLGITSLILGIIGFLSVGAVFIITIIFIAVWGFY